MSRTLRGEYGCQCVCHDRATLTTSIDYWVPGVGVTGVHELVGNALVMKGEKERTIDIRLEPLPGKEGTADETL